MMQIKLFAIEPQTRMHARNQHFSPAASLFLSLWRAGAKNLIHPGRKTDSKGTHTQLCVRRESKRKGAGLLRTSFYSMLVRGLA